MFDNTRARSEGWELISEEAQGETIWTLRSLDERYKITNPVDGRQLQSADMGLRRMIYHAAEVQQSAYHREMLEFVLNAAPEIYEAVVFGREL